MAGIAEAIILCGGLGERLRTVVNDRPKPMALIDSEPLLKHIVLHLQGQGIRRVILATGYMGDYIQEQFEVEGVEIIISQESEPLGTGGATYLAMQQVRNYPVLVLNGDSYCPFSLTSMHSQHIEGKATVSMLVVEVNDAAEYGTVSMDEDNRVTSFEEKCRGGTSWVNAGVYLFSETAREAIVETHFSLETDLFPLLAEKSRMLAIPEKIKFHDIGTPDRYAHAKAELGGRDN